MVQVRKNVKAGKSVRKPASPKQAAGVRGPVDALLDANLFKALSDPTRLLLLGCMIKCGRGCTVGEVAECCSVDLSVVSRHLAALADAGVLVGSKSGRTVTYKVRTAFVCGRLRDLAEAIETCCPAGCGPGCSCGPGCGTKGGAGGCC